MELKRKRTITLLSIIGTLLALVISMSVPPSVHASETSAHVSVHDPSVVKANDTYYVFGSHRAWAKSDDLVHWETFTNNLNDEYSTILGDIWDTWSGQNDNNNHDITGNMWAPDVLWNSAMNKWCMYMSVNGGGFPYQKSAIVLLTADDIEGDWTYVGPVVYSGFQEKDVANTDVNDVLGKDADLSRYASLEDTGINAIDADLNFDENGDLWMSFGSWFGGIWMLKLDSDTGLRDYSQSYELVKDASDPYYGRKVAGGHWNSGEGASYIKVGDWWYLFISYGELGQKGGYQIREFRSKSLTGPYVDQNGHSAIYTKRLEDNSKINRGLRVLGSSIQTGTTEIRTAQGGNSILVEGNDIYNVYHTRFIEPTESLLENEVRVQQMMITPSGWLVSTPYSYTGDFEQKDSYSVDEVLGTYQFVVNDPTIQYEGGGQGSDGIYRSHEVSLNADGTLSGFAQGTWELDNDVVRFDISASKPGSQLHGGYEGVLAEQSDETGEARLVFGAEGGDSFRDAGLDVTVADGRAAIWGAKAVETVEPTPVPNTDPAPQPGVTPSPGTGTEADTNDSVDASKEQERKFIVTAQEPAEKLASTGSDLTIFAGLIVLLCSVGTAFLVIHKKQLINNGLIKPLKEEA